MKQNSELLGKTVEDGITGFKGVVTGHVSYLTGCDQLLIQPKGKKDSLPEPLWFDINRLSVDDRHEQFVIETSVHAGPDKKAPVK